MTPAERLNLVPITTPAESPEWNGMSERRQQVEGQVPLARHDRVQPLADRAGLDVGDLTLHRSAVAYVGLAVRPPLDRALGNRRGEALPHRGVLLRRGGNHAASPLDAASHRYCAAR
jgi:hypothetical protein